MAGNNLATARHDLQRWHERLDTSGIFRSRNRFWVRLAATVAVAAEIVSSGDKILSFDAERVTTWLIDEMKERLEIAVEMSDAWHIDALARFLEDNSQNQLGVSGPFVPGQTGADIFLKPTRELRVRTERSTARMYISRPALRDWCVKHGMNLRDMIKAMIAEWFCLNQSKNLTLGAGTDYAGARVRCLEINTLHARMSGLAVGGGGDVVPFARPERRDRYDDEYKDVPF
jgi:hypothetical protein